MKKVMITLFLICTLCFAGCDKSTMRNDASTRASEPSTTLGDRIEQGLTDASERVSEGASKAEDKLEEGATRVSEAASSIAEDAGN